MLIAAPLILMLAAGPATDPVGAGRKAFGQCLSSQIQPSLEKKLSLGEFQSAIKKACADKEAAFRAAVVADDKSSKMSDADANSDADDQVAEYLDKITAEYEDYNKPG
jgi:hypothetical protein